MHRIVPSKTLVSPSKLLLVTVTVGCATTSYSAAKTPNPTLPWTTCSIHLQLQQRRKDWVPKGHPHAATLHPRCLLLDPLALSAPSNPTSSAPLCSAFDEPSVFGATSSSPCPQLDDLRR